MKGSPQKKDPNMRKKLSMAVALSAVLGLGVTAQSANAHVSTYVAGMSGVAVNTDSVNATYIVSFAPGHGCSGPRTAANPTGDYDTTSMEVFLPRSASGAFILPEVRVVNSSDYRVTVKSVVDPADAKKKRVSSIVFDNFVLPAANNGYASRDTMMLSIAVRLPTFAAVKAAGYTFSAGDPAAARGAKIYFPSVQYCDVTGMGVGIQAATSTPATVTDTVDPVCVAADTIQTALYDDWRTVGNTPSVTIGTALGTTALPALEISGNAPTTPAAVAPTFCSDPSGIDRRGLPLANEFSVSREKDALSIVIDGSLVHSKAQFRIKNANGQVVLRGKLNSFGDVEMLSKAARALKVKKGDVLRLYSNGVLLSVDAA
jgi:hypothetical protein